MAAVTPHLRRPCPEQAGAGPAGRALGPVILPAQSAVQLEDDSLTSGMDTAPST